MDFGARLKQNAEDFPEKAAVIFKDRVTTYRELNERAARFANAITSLGIQPGDRVAVILKNRTEYLEIMYGLVKAGITLVPVNWRLAPQEMEYVINNSDSSAAVLSQEFLERISPIMKDLRNVASNRYVYLGGNPPPGMHAYERFLSDASDGELERQGRSTDPFFIGYTSGTTGFPKGAVSPHGNWDLKVMSLSALFGLTEHDVQLLTMPLFHANAITSSSRGHYGGQTIVMMERFEAEEALRLIEKHRITFSSMVPTMFNRLVNLPRETFQKYDVSSVKGLIQSSAPIIFSTKQWIIENFRNAGLHEFYGGTEVGVVTYLPPEEQLKRPGSVGRALPTVEIKLVDDQGNEVKRGEIGELISRPMRGAPVDRARQYYRDEESSERSFKGGWFHSGDMARVDQDGFYYLVDRKFDMIISGGENVYPAEVEAVLYRHPKILEAAVIGIPDKDWGESVKAAIVLKDGETATEEEIIGYCRVHLAGYKVPRSVDFAEELPKTDTGKILKRLIKAPYWKDRDVRI